MADIRPQWIGDVDQHIAVYRRYLEAHPDEEGVVTEILYGDADVHEESLSPEDLDALVALAKIGHAYWASNVEPQ